jgi:hypothetical protein
MQVAKAQEKLHVKRADANARASQLLAALKNNGIESGVAAMFHLEVSS